MRTCALALLLCGCATARPAHVELCASPSDSPACSRCANARDLACRDSPLTEARARAIAEQFVLTRGDLVERAPIAARCGRRLEGYDWAVAFRSRRDPQSVQTLVVSSDGNVALGEAATLGQACPPEGRSAEEAVARAEELIRVQGYGSALGDLERFQGDFLWDLYQRSGREQAMAELRSRRGTVEDAAFGVFCPATRLRGNGDDWIVVFKRRALAQSGSVAARRSPFGPGGYVVVVPPSGPPYLAHSPYSIANVDRAVCR